MKTARKFWKVTSVVCSGMLSAIAISELWKNVGWVPGCVALGAGICVGLYIIEN